MFKKKKMPLRRDQVPETCDWLIYFCNLQIPMPLPGLSMTRSSSWLGVARRLEIWAGDSVGERRLSWRQLPHISECQPCSLNNDNEITLSSLSLCFCEWAGCVSIMMSGEMMMNWVRQKHPQLPRTMMVTRHDSYAVISISPGKLLSTFVSFIKWSCLSSEKQRIFIGLSKNVKDEKYRKQHTMTKYLNK